MIVKHRLLRCIYTCLYPLCRDMQHGGGKIEHCIYSITGTHTQVFLIGDKDTHFFGYMQEKNDF